MARQSDLAFITKAKELYYNIMTVMQKSPKQFRFSLVSRFSGTRWASLLAPTAPTRSRNVEVVHIDLLGDHPRERWVFVRRNLAVNRMAMRKGGASGV